MSKQKKKTFMVALMPQSGKQKNTTGPSSNVLIYIAKRKQGSQPLKLRKYNPVTRRHEEFVEKKISKN